VIPALQPFGGLTGARIEEPEDWKFERCEILARKRGRTDNFPFPWYASMTRVQRQTFTFRCALVSYHLKKRGVCATFNVQQCDKPAVTTMLATLNIGWCDVEYEMAEFGEATEDGQIGNPKIGYAQQILDYRILDLCQDAYLDDCGGRVANSGREYSNLLELVAEQARRVAQGILERRAFHTIKIDAKPAFKAFNHRVPNPHAPAPDPVDCLREAASLDMFVTAVWAMDPGMRFVVEATITSQAEQDRVPRLSARDTRVDFQSCHLRTMAVPVAFATLPLVTAAA